MERDCIVLDFDDYSVECDIQGIFELNDISYVALIDAGESDDVYIYRYKEYEDEFELTDITDEKEFEEVSAEYYRLMI